MTRFNINDKAKHSSSSEIRFQFFTKSMFVFLCLSADNSKRKIFASFSELVLHVGFRLDDARKIDLQSAHSDLEYDQTQEKDAIQLLPLLDNASVSRIKFKYFFMPTHQNICGPNSVAHFFGFSLLMFGSQSWKF